MFQFLLYSDDLVVITETEDDLIKRLHEWRDNIENRGMRVNMKKSYGMMRHVRSGKNTRDTRVYKPKPRYAVFQKWALKILGSRP